MSGSRRADAGVAVSDLFARSSATGGLATRPETELATERVAVRREPVARLRQGVELTDLDVDFLRSLSRPARTGQPRTLGSKFVATALSRRRSAARASSQRLQRSSRHLVEVASLDSVHVDPALAQQLDRGQHTAERSSRCPPRPGRRPASRAARPASTGRPIGPPDHG